MLSENIFSYSPGWPLIYNTPDKDLIVGTYITPGKKKE